MATAMDLFENLKLKHEDYSRKEITTTKKF